MAHPSLLDVALSQPRNFSLVRNPFDQLLGTRILREMLCDTPEICAWNLLCARYFFAPRQHLREMNIRNSFSVRLLPQFAFCIADHFSDCIAMPKLLCFPLFSNRRLKPPMLRCQLYYVLLVLFTWSVHIRAHLPKLNSRHQSRSKTLITFLVRLI